jgi:hypothetical protein
LAALLRSDWRETTLLGSAAAILIGVSSIDEFTAMGSLFPFQSSNVPPNSGPSGWLYVLSNYTMPGYVKVGYTCGNLHERIRQLQGQTANPGIFVLELCYYSDSVEMHERTIFEMLDAYRVNKRREFFVGSPELAYYKLKEYFGRGPDWMQQRLQEILHVKIDPT